MKYKSDRKLLDAFAARMPKVEPELEEEDELWGEAQDAKTTGEPSEDHSGSFFEALKNRIRKVRGY